jgi:hypothetical protein
MLCSDSPLSWAFPVAPCLLSVPREFGANSSGSPACPSIDAIAQRVGASIEYTHRAAESSKSQSNGNRTNTYCLAGCLGLSSQRGIKPFAGSVLRGCCNPEECGDKFCCSSPGPHLHTADNRELAKIESARARCFAATWEERIGGSAGTQEPHWNQEPTPGSLDRA